MGIVIAGHQRSGTSLLGRILDSQPDISITGEFGCYMHLDIPLAEHRTLILKRWIAKRNSPFIRSGRRQPAQIKGLHFAKNLLFVSRYLRSLYRQRAEPVTGTAVTHALRSIFPASAFTGDKYPDYAFHLDRLTGDPDIQTIVIIRDPRDVVSSTLVKARGVWRNSWPAEMRDAGEIARRWVNILDSTEQHRDNIHTVIYEQLVNHPQTVLSELATFIGVDGQSFDASLIHTNSIGKYRQGLSPAELDRVLAIAGERMQAFGYRLHDPARFD